MTDAPHIVASSAITSKSQEGKGNPGRTHWAGKDIRDLLDFLLQHKTEIRNDSVSQKAWEAAAAAAHLYPPDTGTQTVSDRCRLWVSLKQQEPRMSSAKGRYDWKQSTGRARWTDKDIWDVLDSLVQHTTEVFDGNFSEKAREAEATAAHLYPPDTGAQTVSDCVRLWVSLKQQEPRIMPPTKGRLDGWMETTSPVQKAFQSTEVWIADDLPWMVSRVDT
jgi:hypothetical protein